MVAGKAAFLSLRALRPRGKRRGTGVELDQQTDSTESDRREAGRRHGTRTRGKDPVARVAAERPRTPPPEETPRNHIFQQQTALRRANLRRRVQRCSSDAQAAGAGASGRSWARHGEKLLVPVRGCSPHGSAARLSTALAEHNEQYASIPLRAERTRLTIGAATGEKARRGMRQGRALLATLAQVPGRCSDGAA
jgi:hypothetical protein